MNSKRLSESPYRTNVSGATLGRLEDAISGATAMMMWDAARSGFFRTLYEVDDGVDEFLVASQSVRYGETISHVYPG